MDTVLTLPVAKHCKRHKKNVINSSALCNQLYVWHHEDKNIRLKTEHFILHLGVLVLEEEREVTSI